MLNLMYITNNPQVGLIAEKRGVDRIWIDLETLGKEERQKNLDAVKSKHTVGDVKIMSEVLTSASLLVRVNPWNENSKREIEEVLEAGAEIIMLPMWKTLEEVQNFLTAVSGRCKTVLLLETKEGVEILDQVLEKAIPDEIHIGLNDLHLSYGLDFMFQLLADGTVDKLCEKIRAKNIPYGFGGIAKLGSGMVKAQMIIAEHYRLGSTRAILSRSFCNFEKAKDFVEIEHTFSQGMKELREYEQSLNSWSEREFQENKEATKSAIEEVADLIRKNKSK